MGDFFCPTLKCLLCGALLINALTHGKIDLIFARLRFGFAIPSTLCVKLIRWIMQRKVLKMHLIFSENVRINIYGSVQSLLKRSKYMHKETNLFTVLESQLKKARRMNIVAESRINKTWILKLERFPEHTKTQKKSSGEKASWPPSVSICFQIFPLTFIFFLSQVFHLELLILHNFNENLKRGQKLRRKLTYQMQFKKATLKCWKVLTFNFCSIHRSTTITQLTFAVCFEINSLFHSYYLLKRRVTRFTRSEF